MDPNATLLDIMGCFAELRKDPSNPDLRTHAGQRLRELAEWIDRGGFAPDVDRFTAEWNEED